MVQTTAHCIIYRHIYSNNNQKTCYRFFTDDEIYSKRWRIAICRKETEHTKRSKKKKTSKCLRASSSILNALAQHSRSKNMASLMRKLKKENKRVYYKCGSNSIIQSEFASKIHVMNMKEKKKIQHTQFNERFQTKKKSTNLIIFFCSSIPSGN